MQGYNCIMVFHKDGKQALFCKRLSDPYKGKYNLVGGKIEPGEEVFAAAYRELEEEDFFSLERFAGEGNIGHMIQQVKDYGMGLGEDR